ncbi:hypothetical protein D4764_06G0013760 [Takifugu flavidus]|uniref:Uncharacterized protein n=1 Tax=Takifugu flavidus TaxID=433684 RepID=A0A5C6MXS0_9TELE|nr:hypothetical protein D4764_06G0013760 [Takifugu flavidus]
MGAAPVSNSTVASAAQRVWRCFRMSETRAPSEHCPGTLEQGLLDHHGGFSLTPAAWALFLNPMSSPTVETTASSLTPNPFYDPWEQPKSADRVHKLL